MADPITIGLAVVGTAISAMGTIAGGYAAAAAGNYNAKIMERQAGQERASAQREAAEQRRRAGIAQSSVQAAAAAGGGGALDAGVVKLAEGIAGEGEYRALLSMYEGKNRAQGMEVQAGAQRFEGKAKKAASRWQAAATIAGGGLSLMDKYGGPDTTATTTRGPTSGPYSKAGLRPF